MYIVTRKNSKVESNLNSDDLLVYLFGGAIYQNRGSEIAEDNESWSQFAITLWTEINSLLYTFLFIIALDLSILVYQSCMPLYVSSVSY